MDSVYGLPAEQIAERAGVDVSTARRWKSGAVRMPTAAQRLLEADLGCFGAYWRGWKIEGEELVSPEGWRISRGQVLNVPLMRQQLAAYQKELRAKVESENRLEEQPRPDQWEYKQA
jgi:transcriptional regulator with XRE-family HTH domain